MAIDYPPVFINKYLAERIPSDLPDYFAGDMRFFPTQPTTIDTFTEEFPESAEEPFAVYDRMFRMRRGPFPHKRTEQLLYYFYKTSGGIDALIETVQAVADLLDDGDESAEDLNLWIKDQLEVSPGDYATRKSLRFTRKSITSNVATLTTSESHPFKVGDVIVVKETNPLTNAPTTFAGTFTVTDVPANNQVSYAKTGVDVSERDAQGSPTVGIGHPTMRFNGKDFFLPYFHETKIYQLEEARDIIDFGTARTYAGNKVIIEYCWHKSS